MTCLLVGMLLPLINGLMNQKTSHVSDTSASRSVLPTGEWERQDLVNEMKSSTRWLAPGLHAWGAFPTHRPLRPAAPHYARRTPPPPVWGYLVWLLGELMPALALF